MIFKAPQMGVGGRVRYTFLDPETGERIPAINAETGEEVWGGEWYSNMITDAGLDRLATINLLENGFGAGSPLTLTGSLPDIKESSGAVTAQQTGDVVTASSAFFAVDDVGRAIVWADGSNARIIAFNSATSVQVDKTQVVASQAFERWHVDIATLPGPLDAGTTGASSVAASWDDDDWILTVTTWRQVELAESRNINGFGLGVVGVGATNALIIENLRDSGGNPITVSMLAGKAVRLDHVFEFRYPRANKAVQVQVDEYDAANQLVGSTTHEADLWLAPQTLSAGAVEGAFRAINPSTFRVVTNTSNINFVARFLGERPFTPGGIASGTPSYTPSATSLSGGLGAYTAGSRRRVLWLEAAAGYANGDVYGVLFRSSSSGRFGAMILQFRAGEQFVKASSHTLRIGYEISWDRDYSI